MTYNSLREETSPYLLQHKDNPVHWRPWGDSALAAARESEKPILLSVGYSACHWCHVMAHESFEDPEIASVMNDLFVNIKVDREERPDLDSIYQSALALMGQQGGWPLTMFLTPDGEPFWGGTYFPATPRYGRPGFTDVLRGVADAYRTQPEKVQKNVAALRDAIGKLGQPASGNGLSRAVLDDVASKALRLIDPLRGGTAGAPKFPQPVFFRALWHAYRRTGSALFRDAVTVTLNNLCQGGIYDHLGGGFARYATDEAWLVPHFEKMLYDNALLVDLLTEVWRDARSPLYAIRVSETIDWVLTEMRVDAEDGDGFAFASAFDADSEGEEGRYYVWSEAEIDTLLGTDSPVFKEAYDVSQIGNWEGHTILNRSARSALGSDVLETKLAECRRILLSARSQRIPPLRDDKVLTDWNGLMIAALTDAAVTFDRQEWLAAAQTAFDFVVRRMTVDGRLRHSWRAGQARHPAVIDDYAAMALAAIRLYEATGVTDYLARAATWTTIADNHYWDASASGYFQSADDTGDVIARTKTILDNAVPSGNNVMLDVLARMYHITADPMYRDRAEALVTLFSSDSVEYLMHVPGLLIGHERLDNAVQVVIIGEPDDADALALRQAAFQASTPLRVISPVTPSAVLPEGHPAFGKTTVEGTATAYVCVGQTCGLPMTDPEALTRHLADV